MPRQHCLFHHGHYQVCPSSPAPSSCLRCMITPFSVGCGTANGATAMSSLSQVTPSSFLPSVQALCGTSSPGDCQHMEGLFVYSKNWYSSHILSSEALCTGLEVMLALSGATGPLKGRTPCQVTYTWCLVALFYRFS